MTGPADKAFHPKYVKIVKDQGCFFLTQKAFYQLKKAYDNYTPGVAVGYGNKSFLAANMEQMFGGKGVTTVQTVGRSKLVKTTLPNGKSIPQMIGAPCDEDLDLTPLHAMHLCAICGKKKQSDGQPLLACGGCKDRFYCSKACQKKGWKLHKVICKRPADEIKAFIDSVLPDWIAGASQGGPQVFESGGVITLG